MFEAIIAICTILGGIAALEYFIEKALAKRRLRLPPESPLHEHSDAGLRATWTNKRLRAVSGGTLLVVSVTIGAYFLLRPSAIDRMAALAEGGLARHCDKAIITGHVIPHGSETFAWFEWGETPELGRDTIKQRFTEEADYYQHLAPLKENTTYYYKAVVADTYGRTDCEVRAFKTPHCGN